MKLQKEKDLFINRLKDLGLVEYADDSWYTPDCKIYVYVHYDLRYQYLFIRISPLPMQLDGAWNAENAIKRIQDSIQENLESCK